MFRGEELALWSALVFSQQRKVGPAGVAHHRNLGRQLFSLTCVQGVAFYICDLVPWDLGFRVPTLQRGALTGV